MRKKQAGKAESGEPRGTRSGLAPRLILLAVATAVSVSVALLLLEIGLRVIHPITTLYYHSPHSDYLMHPNRSIRFATEEFDTAVQTNRFGLRGAEPDLTKQIRLLLLGDSFAFGHGVDIEDSFAHRLERELDRALDGQVTLVNAGHNGFDTRRELGYLKHHGLAFRPTVVLVAFTLNDLYSNSGEYRFSPIATGFVRRIPLLSVATLAEYLKSPKKLLRKLGWDVEYDRSVDHFDCLRPNAECVMAWERTRTCLAELQQFASEHDLPVVLLNIPVAEQIEFDEERTPYDIRGASTKLAEISDALGIIFIDLADDPKQTADNYFAKDGHWNARGHAAAAAYLFRRVFESGLITDLLARQPVTRGSEGAAH